MNRPTRYGPRPSDDTGRMVRHGAGAEWLDGRPVVRGCAAALDGSEVVHVRAVGSPVRAEELGRRVARDLLGRGAAVLMSAREEVDADD